MTPEQRAGEIGEQSCLQRAHLILHGPRPGLAGTAHDRRPRVRAQWRESARRHLSLAREYRQDKGSVLPGGSAR